MAAEAEQRLATLGNSQENFEWMDNASREMAAESEQRLGAAQQRQETVIQTASWTDENWMQLAESSQTINQFPQQQIPNQTSQQQNQNQILTETNHYETYDERCHNSEEAEHARNLLPSADDIFDWVEDNLNALGPDLVTPIQIGGQRYLCFTSNTAV